MHLDVVMCVACELSWLYGDNICGQNQRFPINWKFSHTLPWLVWRSSIQLLNELDQCLNITNLILKEHQISITVLSYIY